MQNKNWTKYCQINLKRNLHQFTWACIARSSSVRSMIWKQFKSLIMRDFVVVKDMSVLLTYFCLPFVIGIWKLVHGISHAFCFFLPMESLLHVWGKIRWITKIADVRMEKQNPDQQHGQTQLFSRDLEILWHSLGFTNSIITPEEECNLLDMFVGYDI